VRREAVGPKISARDPAISEAIIFEVECVSRDFWCVEIHHTVLDLTGRPLLR
ncbi:hypothetical protein WA026_016113, partial [Henosepilachna vigintioctopunctata]